MVARVFQYLKRRLGKAAQLSNLVAFNHIGHPSESQPLVSIIIPTRDKLGLLRGCISSIRENTSYKNFEIMIVDNLTRDPEALEYLDLLRTQGVKILKYSKHFNFSKILNFAASHTNAEILCFLNNDIKVLSNNWLGDMVEHVQQPKIGVVGSCLVYPDHKVQHVGISLGYKGIAGHPYAREELSKVPTQSCFEVSAVTFACALLTSETFRTLGGLDTRLAVGLNDVDFGYRLTKLGYRNVVCMNSRLVHLESQSRKKMRNPLGAARAALEVLIFLSKHKAFQYEDRYFK